MSAVLKPAPSPAPFPALKLYELPAAFAKISDEIDDAGGELTDEIATRLAALEGNLEAKVEACCKIIQMRLRTAEARKLEARRLSDLAAVDVATADRLKQYVLMSLDAIGVDRIETQSFKVGIQMNGQASITWTKPLAELPAEYIRTIIEPDNSKAREDLKAGKELPEGFDVSRGRHLRIR